MATYQEQLAAICDETIRTITRQETGILLTPGEIAPIRPVCTVSITVWDRDSYLSLCAETVLFTRLARSVMQEEHVTLQDVEDVAKEYLNLLGGHVISELFREKRIPVRFSVPAFHPGRYAPPGSQRNLVLTYSSDQHEFLELVQHTLCRARAEQLDTN